MYKALIIILSLIVLSSCFKAKNRVIPEEDMVGILAKLHIGDAMLKDQVREDLFENPDSVDLHTEVLEEYGYDRAAFDSTLKWYSHHPEKLNKLYQHMLAALSEKEAPLSEKVPAEDTVLYQDEEGYKISGVEFPEKLQLKIPDMGIGEYKVRVVATAYDDDQSVNPAILVYHENQDKQELIAQGDHARTYVKDGNKRTYTVNTTIRDSGRFTYYVDLLYSPEPESLERAHLDISNVRISFNP